jgi:hypothetical protein
MLQLATPISMPNITRVDVLKFIDDRDDDVPSCGLVLHFVGAGASARARDGGTFTVRAYDERNSTKLVVNANPTGYGDNLLSGSADIPGACTAIGDAYDAATGGRKAKREAAFAAALMCGILGPGLAAT